MTFFGFSGGPAIPGLIDYNFIKFRDAVGKVFAVRNKIMQQEIGKGSYFNFKNQFIKTVDIDFVGREKSGNESNEYKVVCFNPRVQSKCLNILFISLSVDILDSQ